jgi:hypothetical protein
MKKRIMVLSICLGLLMLLGMANTSWAAGIGSAKVYGKITLANGQPAANVRVRVMVEGIDWRDFPWKVYFVPTDAQGNYSVSIKFPQIPGVQFIAEVYKIDTAPFEYEFNWMKFKDNPPQSGRSYQINVKLKANPNYAAFRGLIVDAETGLPMQIGGINVSAGGKSDWFYVHSNGYYEGVINLTQPSAVATIYSPVGTEDVLYEKKQITPTLEAGKHYWFTFWLTRKKAASYIYGTVRDAATGQPIQDAHVVMRYPDGSGREVGLTDFLGRFGHYVPEPGTYHVNTLGAHTNDAAVSPYLREVKHVTVGANSSEKVDFQMIKK